jgi:hypothetical protein
MNLNTISLPCQARPTKKKRCAKLEIDGWKKFA